MRTSAKTASIFILLFFLLFNGIQVYLITQRIAGAKEKFNTATTTALLATIFQYDKIQRADTASTPKNALITYTLDELTVNRIDSQNIALTSPTSRLYAIRVNPASIETIINKPRSLSLDLSVFAALYRKSLDSMKIHSEFRLDTFPIPFKPGNNGEKLTERVNGIWEGKRAKEYPYSTNPQRIFFYPTALIFAQHKQDFSFLSDDLLWPMMGYFFILLISNTALVFVYKTIRKQKRINELKTNFINNITHEMKTPLTIASAGLEALEHHITPTEKINFYLSTSKRQLRMLNEFIERILDAAYQEIPEFKLQKTTIDLRALFEELIQSHSMLQAKRVSFSLNAERHIFIEGDGLHLETAFQNIIDNSIKYTDGDVEINIDIIENNRDCIIRIKDNGKGIPLQYSKRIFERFFRVPQGDTQSVKGFGLGLYHVSNIVNNHGGTIYLNSQITTGTEFIIKLPRTHDTNFTDRRPG